MCVYVCVCICVCECVRVCMCVCVCTEHDTGLSTFTRYEVYRHQVITTLPWNDDVRIPDVERA